MVNHELKMANADQRVLRLLHDLLDRPQLLNAWVIALSDLRGDLILGACTPEEALSLVQAAVVAGGFPDLPGSEAGETWGSHVSEE